MVFEKLFIKFARDKLYSLNSFCIIRNSHLILFAELVLNTTYQRRQQMYHKTGLLYRKCTLDIALYVEALSIQTIH